MSISENQGCAAKMHNRMFPMDDAVKGPGCCFCLPLKLGITIICIFFFVDLINIIQLVSRVLAINAIFGAICLPLIPFMLVSCIMAFNYCREDSIKNRKRLVIACTLCLFTNILSFIVFSISDFLVENMHTIYVNLIINHLFSLATRVFIVPQGLFA